MKTEERITKPSPDGSPQGQPRSPRRWLKAALIVVVLAMVLGASYSYYRNRPTSETEIARIESLIVAGKEEEALSLMTGAQVRAADVDALRLRIGRVYLRQGLVGPATAPRILQRLKLYRSNAKRYAPPANGYVFGDLLIDPEGFQARFRGKRINLAPGEFRLLSHFAENADRVLTRRELIELASKDGRVIDERTVDVWVGRLRRALKGHGVPDPLRTVRSVGYVFDRVG